MGYSAISSRIKRKMLCVISGGTGSAALNELGLWLAKANQRAFLMHNEQFSEVCNQWYKHVGVQTSCGWNYCVGFVWLLGLITRLVHSNRQIMSLKKFCMSFLLVKIIHTSELSKAASSCVKFLLVISSQHIYLKVFMICQKFSQLFTTFTSCFKFHKFSQFVSIVLNSFIRQYCTCCKLHVLELARVANCTCCKLHVL